MTLIDSFKTKCTLVERTRVKDREGGWYTQWVDGLSFDAAIVLDASINARVAEAEGVTGVYTVTAGRTAVMEFHDVFRRESDGQMFRVTKVNDPTPNVASFQFTQYQAERWALPNDDE